MYTIGRQTGPLTVETLRRLRAHLFGMNRPGPHTLVLTPQQFRELERDMLRGATYPGAARTGGRYGSVEGFELDVPETLDAGEGARARLDQRGDFYEFARQAIATGTWDLGRGMSMDFWDGVPPPRPAPRTTHSGW